MWLLILFSMLVSAAPEDQITLLNKKVEGLVLKRDRAGAMTTLKEAIERLKNRPKEQLALQDKARTVAQMFFSDEGQKAYESASSLYFYSIREARAVAEKALQLEPGNVRVQTLLINLDFKGQNCSSANQKISEILDVALSESDKSNLRHLFQYCAKAGFNEIELKKANSKYKDFLLGVAGILDGKSTQAKDFLNEMTTKHPQFPETYYWLWKADEKDEESALKYTQLCKNLDVKIQRQYRDFPFLCQMVAEVPAVEVNGEL